MCFGGGNNSAADLAAQQQKAVTAATGQINQAFSGFTPGFFQNYQNAVTASQEPALQEQYQSNKKAADFALAGRGLLNSSAANETAAGLAENYGNAQTSLANEAINASNSLQQQIAQEKANLIGQANAASDPGSIGSSAFNIASSFSQPSPVAPIGNLFQTFANTYLAGRLGSMYNPSGGSGGSTVAGSYNSPNFLGGTSFSNPTGGSAFGITYGH